MNREDVGRRYAKALHAVQSGVATEIETIGVEAAGCTPKHLRVGVNSAMINALALARLLLDKGVFTDEEYRLAIAEAAEHEKAIYEARLSERFGKRVVLS